MRFTTDQALAEAESWLELAEQVAQRGGASYADTESRKADLVHAYAFTADTWVRYAELRAALEHRIIAPVETFESRHADAARAVAALETEASEDGH